MTQVTDRISNSAIVDLAKKQFEDQNKKKIPTVVVELTSKGLIYPESHPLRKGYVHMRHMSAYDEDIIVNETYISKNIVFDMLLAELITDDIDIDDIAIVDREGLIINAYILGYGNDYDVTVTDPKLGKSVQRIINLTSLISKPFNLVPDKNGEFSYDVDDETKIKFRYITADRNESADDTVISNFLKRCITEVNGDRSATAIDTLLQMKFPPKISKQFRKYYVENAPSIIDEIEFQGEDGDTFKSRFRFDPTVFWT